MTTKPTKLLNKNFLLLWQGQFVSLIGSQAHNIAMLFWIKHTTGSASLMGTILMLAMIPSVILGPIGGALADRFSRRKIIVITDLLNGLLILSLAVLMFSKPDSTTLVITWLFIVAVVNGILSSLFRPAISAFIPDLVPKDKITGANSAITSSAQFAQLIGQGLGGVAFRLLGAPVLFLIDGLSFLFSGISELFISEPEVKTTEKDLKSSPLKTFLNEIKEGFHYVWRQKGLRELIVMAAFMNFFGAPFITLLPFYVENVLNSTTDWYGILLATEGIGVLIGAIVTGALKISGKTRCNLMLILLLCVTLCEFFLGFARTIPLALCVMFLLGFSSGMVNVYIGSIIQMATPQEIRGRVFGLLGAVASGLMPIGMGLSGIIADMTGKNIPLIYAVSGGATAVLAIYLGTRTNFRRFLAGN